MSLLHLPVILSEQVPDREKDALIISNPGRTARAEVAVALAGAGLPPLVQEIQLHVRGDGGVHAMDVHLVQHGLDVGIVLLCPHESNDEAFLDTGVFEGFGSIWIS